MNSEFCLHFFFDKFVSIVVLHPIPVNKFSVISGFEVIKLFSCSTQLRLKFILLINVKMPTVVGILTFISRINYKLCLS